ncbi:MAG: preprotein translocase subunit SecE [Candidatus Niyogibacteria bacterium]|nr:MAG: preprotein translocase subunit SecE [Candidatus Niyogibacteria bacterium]
MGFFARLIDYLKSTRLEVKNVNWPTRRETIRFTLLVIAVSAGIAAYLGFLDFIFINILEKFVL